MATFKVCNNCGKSWADRDAFLDDPAISIIGYQAVIEDFTKGIFLFNCMASATGEPCNSTIAAPIMAFIDLYDGQCYEILRAGNPDCPGKCQRIDDLSTCSAQCRNAPVREVARIIHERFERARRRAACED